MGEDLFIISVLVFGQEVSKPQIERVLDSESLIYQSLSNFLLQFEQCNVCEGITASPIPTNYDNVYCHPVIINTDNTLKVHEMYRSNNCQIFGSAEESCCKYCQMENKKIATVNIETAQQQGSKTASINHTNEDHFSKIFGRNQGDLNEWQQLFMNHQLQNAGIAPNSRRYHPDIVRWVIEFYYRSPAAYRHLLQSDILCLPSVRTIQRYR
ncbi:uncharacterized protein LOC144750534 [Ciona intestinalis]